MAISLKHLFTSPKADSADATLVQPSNWNAEHVLTQATARLLGRTTAGTGPTEEIEVGSGLTFTGGVLAAVSGDIATNRLLGRSTAGTGPAEEITLGAGLTLSGGTLAADGLADGDKGDITVTSSGTVWTVDGEAITAAKLAPNAVTTVKIADEAVTLPKIAAAARSGLDATLVTGTKGTNGQFAQWNGDGDLIGVAPPSAEIGGSANSRSAMANTAYQNTQGKPIACSSTASLDQQSVSVQISPDNSTWHTVCLFQDSTGESSSTTFGFNWIVPDTWYYRISRASTVIEIY